MVAVVVAEAVGLCCFVGLLVLVWRSGWMDGSRDQVGKATYGNIDERDAGAKVRVRLYLVNEGVLAPIANHETDAE